MKIVTEVSGPNDENLDLEFEHDNGVVIVSLDRKIIFSMDYTYNLKILLKGLEAIIKIEETI